MDIFVRGGQRNALHVHANRDKLAFVRAPVHNFILHQGLGLCLAGRPSAEGLLPNQSDLHAL